MKLASAPLSVHHDPRGFIMVTDVVLLLACVGGANLLRGSGAPMEGPLVLMAPFLAVPVFVRMGLYRAVFRYIGSKAMLTVAKAVTLHAMTLGAIVGFTVEGSFYRLMIIYWLLALVVVGGSRVLVRSLLRWAARAERQPARVVIYGAGSAGAELAEALASSDEYEPVAFIDDKRELHGREIRGLRVFPTARLPSLVADEAVSHVLLAIPSAAHDRRVEITRLLESFHVHVKTVPSLQELMSGASSVRELRELDINDLLDRDSVAPDHALLDACISGKSVMVTGAGGSIGSELCRQIVKCRPRQLLLFERSEYALYTIEREICALVQGTPGGEAIEVVPLLGSVTDAEYLHRVLDRFSVETLYHAAAYKHVPMVEHNPLQGILNNVFGTLRCAQAAVDAGVETFTLISTDKAVRPKNVMGATKRAAELIVQALSAVQSGTRFSTVRFGNVLGSSGSVVPLFREQIEKGGPVTITHRDVTRYFMTIPEAAQLVIQASAMGGDGDVFVLDMGEPVRIIDLAKRMVALSGLTVKDEHNPNGDIAIVVTQLRPGEKLHEELVIGGTRQATAHARIMRVKEEAVPWVRLERVLENLDQVCGRFDAKEACDVLRALTGYQPGEVTELRGKHKKPVSSPPSSAAEA